MATYHVDVAYKTKRQAVCFGMTVEAFGPDEAEEIARNRVLKGYPARKFCWSKVSEATPADIALGVSVSDTMTDHPIPLAEQAEACEREAARQIGYLSRAEDALESEACNRTAATLRAAAATIRRAEADEWIDGKPPADGLWLVTNAIGQVCPAEIRDGFAIVQNMVGFADWEYGRPIIKHRPLPAPLFGEAKAEMVSVPKIETPVMRAAGAEALKEFAGNTEYTRASACYARMIAVAMRATGDE